MAGRPMSAPEFFIDDDAHGDLWVWRENGDRPIPMLNLYDLGHTVNGAALLDLIRAAVEGEVREEWGVRDEDDVYPCHSEKVARSFGDQPDCTPVRRTVITGAWEEER